MVSDGRKKRLEDNVAREVAELLLTGLKQPLPGVLTITGVELARDLSRARVLYTAWGQPEEKQRLARKLRQVASFVQREVARRLHLRVTPQLVFQYDDASRRGARVLELLAELEEKDGDSPDHSD